jgi:hypothetical protein
VRDGHTTPSCRIRLVGDSNWGEEGGGTRRRGSEGRSEVTTPELGLWRGGGSGHSRHRGVSGLTVGGDEAKWGGGGGGWSCGRGGKGRRVGEEPGGGRRGRRAVAKPGTKKATWCLPHSITLFVSVACLWFYTELTLV